MYLKRLIYHDAQSQQLECSDSHTQGHASKIPFFSPSFHSPTGPPAWNQESKIKGRSHWAMEPFTYLTYWAYTCCLLPHQCHCGWWWRSQEGWEYLEWWLADADLGQGLGNYKKTWYGEDCSQPENRLEKAEHPEKTCRKRSQERRFSPWPPKLFIFSPELFPTCSLIPFSLIIKSIHLTTEVPKKLNKPL